MKSTTKQPTISFLSFFLALPGCHWYLLLMYSTFDCMLQESGIPLAGFSYAVAVRSEASIHRYLRGQTVPRIKTALLIRATIGMPVEKWVDPIREEPYRPKLPASDPSRGTFHLRTHLRRFKVSQVELAYKTGSGQKNVHQWLTCQTRPSVEKAVLLQHHFNIPVATWYRLSTDDFLRIKEVRRAAGLTGATALEGEGLCSI